MLKIVGKQGNLYNVLDTDDGVTQSITGTMLLTYKGVGIDIVGCHYDRYALVVDIDDVRYDKSFVKLPEVWHNVVGIKRSSNYEVSNYGKVRYRVSKNTTQSVSLVRKQQGCFVLINGIEHAVDKLVAMAFARSGYREGLAVVHLDGDVLNNRVDNLSWGMAQVESVSLSELQSPEYLESAPRVSRPSKQLQSEHLSTVVQDAVIPELQRWYQNARARGPGDMERWVPAPIINCKRRDGSWMYEVSDRGRVRHSDFIGVDGLHHHSKILKLFPRKKSCPTVPLYDPNGVQRRVSVARLVAIAFVENPNMYNSVLHKDGDVNNCSWDNLYWGRATESNEQEDVCVEQFTKRVIRQYSALAKLVREYDSIPEAAESTDISTVEIRKCCNIKFRTIRGFLWRFSDDDDLQKIRCSDIDMSVEIWRPISLITIDLSKEGNYARYEVSNFGRVRRPPYTSAQGVVYGEKILKLHASSGSDSLKFHFRDSEKGATTIGVALLVATEFIPNPHGYKRILHLDGDVTNSRADNLAWSEAGRKLSVSRFSATVRQYSLDGTLISEYDTLENAAKATGCDPSALNRAVESLYANKTAGGYIWRLSNNDEIAEGSPVVLTDTRRPVRQYSLDGVFIQEFDSVVSAAASCGGSKTNISAVCRGRGVSAFGYMWRFADDDNLADKRVTAKELLQERSAGRKPAVRKPDPSTQVHQYGVDGRLIATHSSAHKAAEAVCCNKSNIVAVCNRKSRSAAGYVWRWARDDDLYDLPITRRAEYFARIHVKARSYNRPVRQYTADKVFIKEYASVARAVEAVDGNRQSIAACCSRKQGYKTSAGYIWRYSDDDEFRVEGDAE